MAKDQSMQQLFIGGIAAVGAIIGFMILLTFIAPADLLSTVTGGALSIKEVFNALLLPFNLIPFIFFAVLSGFGVMMFQKNTRVFTGTNLYVVIGFWLLCAFMIAMNVINSI